MRRALVSLCLFCTQLVAQASEATLERYYQEGERALAENHYADAEQAFEKLRQLSPGTAEVHARLGLIYFQEKKFTQSEPALRQALIYRTFLDNIEPSERVYHRNDPTEWLKRAGDARQRFPLPNVRSW